MGAIDKRSFIWASAGLEPPDPESAIYAPGEQPIAGFDNHAMYAITSDIDELNDHAGSHGREHEAGGAQEIRIDELPIGDVATFVSNGTQLHIADPSDHGTTPVRIDMDADRIREMPDFGIVPVFREGVEVRNDIVDSDGGVLYDHANDTFHHAEEADTADYAVEAGDADLFNGLLPEDFIREGDDAVSASGKWSFDQTIDADISGHASTASRASEADRADDADTVAGRDPSDLAEVGVNETIRAQWAFDEQIVGRIDDADHAAEADVAGFADEADEAALLDGWTRQQIIDSAVNTGRQHTTVADNGADVMAENNPRFSFDDHLSVTQNGSTAQVAVGKVDNASNADTADYADDAGWAQQAEDAADSNRVGGYRAQELIEEARTGMDDGRWSFIGAWEQAVGDDWLWELDVTGHGFDQYRVVTVNEPNGTGNHELWFRVNSEYRDRFYWYQKNCHHGNFFYEDDRGTSFPIALTRYGYPGYGEYVVTMPPTVEDNTAYPLIDEKEYSAHPRAYGGRLLHGVIETEFDSITDFRIEPSKTSAAYIAVFGANFPTA